MATEREDDMTVSFPADPAFTPVGRVAVSGLALRLGFDVARVEHLRLAVDAATAGLCRGTNGTITVKARWSEERLDLTITNLHADLDAAAIAGLTDELAPLVPDVAVGDHDVALVLDM